MKIKTKFTTAFALILLIISALALILNAPVQAQEYANLQEGGSVLLPTGVTADFEVDTTAYLSFRPNPVGLNQPILVNLWIQPAIHASRYMSGYKVIITKPDGNEVVFGPMDSYRADTTAWFEYPADQAGTWTLKFEFPGGYFPAGNYTAYRGTVRPDGTREGVVYEFTESCYYKPASTEEQTLTVQDDIVYSWPISELPTDYWTRPVAFENREWWTIAGNYPWHGPGGGSMWDELYPDTNPYWGPDQRFTPWVQAPNSAHIVWKRTEVLAGLTQFGEYTNPFTLTRPIGLPNIIYLGRCYETLTGVVNGEPTDVWQCYDIRTGEIYWERAITNTPNLIEYDRGYAEVPGAELRQRGDTGDVNFLYIGGGRMMKYDPSTGVMDANVSISPVSSGDYYRNGYALSVQNLGGGNYRLINWTTIGSTDNFADRVLSNITWPWNNLGRSYDVNAGVAVNMAQITPNAMGAWYGTEIHAVSLTTGAELWDATTDETMYSSSTVVVDHGKVAACFMKGNMIAWDLDSGNVAWKSEQMDYPWGESGWGAYSIQSAYGMVFRQSYDGIYAFDWDNGKIVWKYTAPAAFPYETGYIDENNIAVTSFDSHANIADGKMYVLNNEHTPTAPTTRGWGVHCIDAMTGELVWKMMGPWDWGAPGPAADGYLVIASCTGVKYVYGKGQSETTVTAPDAAVAKGTAITIKGTVLDMSPAQPGTPCVSGDSMETQMEYLHTQLPIDSIWGNETIIGVPVTLTAIDSDGDYIDIGKVTTEGYYGTFGLSWTPEEEGTYQIIASFEGDESYSSSGAATYVTVGPAPSADGQIEPEPTFAIPMEITVIAAIIVVAIIALAAVYIIRKRQ